MSDGWCALEISPSMSSSVILKGEEICERLNLAFQETICLESCLLLTGCSLLSNAHMRNTQNISEISQESNWCQKLRCENQAWPESQFQIQSVCWISRISSLVVIFIPTKLHSLLSSFLLVPLVLCIDCFHSALCNVTFPRQRKLLLLEMQVFLSHQALLAPCVNRLWIKAFNLWAQNNVCYQQTEPFSGRIEQTNCPCSKWHQKPLCFCLTKLTLCKI